MTCRIIIIIIIINKFVKKDLGVIEEGLPCSESWIAF